MNTASEVICRAWEQKNPDLLRTIIADDFEWYESPFEEPITNIEVLLKVWEEHLSVQSKIKLEFEILVENSTSQITLCTADITRNSNVEKLAGCYIISLDKNGKVKKFRHFWESK